MDREECWAAIRAISRKVGKTNAKAVGNNRYLNFAKEGSNSLYKRFGDYGFPSYGHEWVFLSLISKQKSSWGSFSAFPRGKLLYFCYRRLEAASPQSLRFIPRLQPQGQSVSFICSPYSTLTQKWIILPTLDLLIR